MTFAVQPPSITDPSSRWLSTCSDDVMHMYSYSPESSPSSPEGFYSIPYYAKMQTDNPATWPTYPCPPRPSSKARLAATVNPRTIIPPFQAPCTSDIDTPSSASSYSVSTPLSPFMQLDIREEELHHDEFEYDDDDDDDDDYIDCDFLGDTEMSEGDQSQKPLNGQFAPQAIKSAVRDDQLEAVEPFNDLHGGGHHPPVHVISDRKMSSSAPGYYPSTPHHSLAVDEEQLRRWLQREQPPDSAALFPGTSAMYASQHPYSHIESSPSLALSAPALLAALHQQLYTSTGAITSTNLSNASGPIPIMQPQPIRPIPPIPIDEFMSNDCGHSDSCAKVLSPDRLERLSPLPLLCQPVSDAVRYQLQGSSSDQPVDDPEYYDDDVVSEGVCENLIITDAIEPFGCEALHSAQVHPTSAIGTCSAEGVVCSCGCQGMLSWR